MKTGDFAILAVVLLVVVMAAAMLPVLTGPGMTLGRAALAAETSPAVGQGVEWVLSLAIKVLLGGAAVGLAAGIVAYLRERGRQSGGGWQSGPNAFWRRNQPRERGLSEAEMMRMLMMRQLMGGQAQGPGMPRVEQDDEEVIRW